MHKKLLFSVFSVLVVLAIAVSPVYAITGNFVQDFEHPFVGLAVFYDASGEFIWRCSGALVEPDRIPHGRSLCRYGWRGGNRSHLFPAGCRSEL